MSKRKYMMPEMYQLQGVLEPIMGGHSNPANGLPVYPSSPTQSEGSSTAPEIVEKEEEILGKQHFSLWDDEE